MIGILVPVAILAILAVLIALAVFVVQRSRSGEPLGISFRTVLLTYFYLMSIASFLVLTGGLSTGVKAGLSNVFGREFSYWFPPGMRVMSVGEGPMRGEDLTPQPVPEAERERKRREVERQYQNDLIQSATFAIVGGVIWVLHSIGRRLMESQEETFREFFRKAQLTIMLAIFSIVGIITLPFGIYQLLQFVIIPVDEFTFRQPPGDTVATAVVFVPVWLFYLAMVLRQRLREA